MGLSTRRAFGARLWAGLLARTAPAREASGGLSPALQPLEPRLLLSDIQGGVWEDLDADGLWDAGEPGLAGWTVFLDSNQNGQADAGEPTQVTGADGAYSFSGLAAGTYWVTEQIQDPWVQCFPALPGAPRTFTNINAGLPGVYEASLDWGDYDGDGDLDLALLGWSGTEAVTRIYRNDDMIFEDSGIALPALRDGALAWGDYDGDGDVDLVLTGDKNPDESLDDRVSRIYRNDGGTLVLTGASLIGVDNSAVAWGDYDADGDLDLVLAGFDGAQAVAKVYRNDAGVFTDARAGLTGVHRAAAAWGDYDGDGDLDLILCGRTTDGAPLTCIYRHDQQTGSFALTTAALPGVDFSAVGWGDYDGDGDLDLALAGNSSQGRIAQIRRNDGGPGAPGFTDIAAGLPGVSGASLAWQDYDLDGWPDLALTGYGGGQRISRVYRNGGLGAPGFTDANVGLMGVNGSSLAWDDVDADGYPDIALAGYTASGAVTQVYRNIAKPGPHVVALSAGQVAADMDFGNYRPCTIQGTKWHDLDGDGVRDDGESFGEQGLGNWKFYLDTDGDAQLDPWEPSSLTDASGAFRFERLSPGLYIVREVPKAGWASSVPQSGFYTVVLTSGQTAGGMEFAGYKPSQIGGGVWDDLDADGAWDADEPGLAGWVVYLDADGDGVKDPGEPSRTTDSYGAYAFLNLRPGQYTVRQVLQEDWQQSAPVGPGGAGGQYSVTAASGDVIEDIDFGNYRGGTISGLVWNDADADASCDEGEAPLAGWTVYLDVNGNSRHDAGEPQQTTGASGAYAFANLRPGAHAVAETVQAPWTPVAPPGGRATVQVTSGQDTTVNFANRLPQPEITVLCGDIEITDGQSNPIDFGSIVEGQSQDSPHVTFTVRNDGEVAMTLGSILLPDGFSLTASPAAAVAPGGSTAFTVRLNADAPGIKSGQVRIANNDSNENPFRIPVTGQVRALARIVVTQGSTVIANGQAQPVDFGSVPQGAAAPEMTFTVTNAGVFGDQDLTVAPVELADGSGFEVTQQPGRRVAGGESTTFTLRMQTARIAANAAQVRFANGSAENPGAPGFVFNVAGSTVNAQPQVDAGPDQFADEARGVRFAGSFTDPSPGQTHTVNWDFGDGSSDSGTLEPSHAYADDGVYTVRLTVTDSQGAAVADTLTVTVANVAPRAGDDQAVTAQDTALELLAADLLANDVDVPADPLALTGVSAGGLTHGTVVLAGGSVTYTPEPGFVGSAEFTYTVVDGDGGSGVGTVRVTVELPVSAMAVVLSAPGGAGEEWANGLYRIQWLGSDAQGSVDLWAFGPGGWQQLAGGVPAGEGGFDWDTATVPEGRYAVLAYFQQGGVRTSSHSLGWLGVRHAVGGPPEFAFQGGGGSGQVVAGSPYRIQWSGGDPRASMSLWVHGPTGWQRVAAGVPADQGRYDWDTTGQPPSWCYFVGHLEADGERISTITSPWTRLLAPPAFAPSVTLVSPEAGQHVQAGEAFEIRWEANLPAGVAMNAYLWVQDSSHRWRCLNPPGQAVVDASAGLYEWDTFAVPPGLYAFAIWMGDYGDLWVNAVGEHWLTVA